MIEPIEFSVVGKPITAGSKKAFPLFKGGKFIRSIITDDTGAPGKSWRAMVQDRAREAFVGRALLDCPLRVWMEFRVVRPKGHIGAKGLRPSAPALPVTKPDVLKMARAIEDALTGVVWRDDSQITTETIRKRYANEAGVTVQIKEDSEEWKELAG